MPSGMVIMTWLFSSITMDRNYPIHCSGVYRLLIRAFAFLLGAWLVTLPGRVGGVLFDWDTVSWTPGSLSNSYDIDASNPGNDITITITGATSRFIPTYPQITQDFEGGLSPAENVLDVFVNYSRRTQSITITVEFHYALGVEDVGFSLFDIDRTDSETFIDEIRTIKANFGTGSDIAATSVTGSANNTVSGSGLGTTITGTELTSDVGAGSGDANATISFGTNALTQFSFVYGDNSDAERDPAQQGIGLYDISFKKRIPEYHPGLVGVLACGLLAVWRGLRARVSQTR